MNHQPAIDLLENIRERLRQACMLRQIGDEQGASEIVNRDLRVLLVQLADSSHLAADSRRRRLEVLFEEEMERVEAGWFVTEMIEERMLDPLLEELDDIREELREIRHRLGSVDYPLNFS